MGILGLKIPLKISVTNCDSARKKFENFLEFAEICGKIGISEGFGVWCMTVTDRDYTLWL